LITSELVIAEIIWVLESYYEFAKDKIVDMASKIINTKGITVINSDMLLAALDIYSEKNIDFIDAFNISLMKKMDLTDILTLDKKHFSRISELEIIQI
jgi:predicted nucleic-acid-binding protein